MKLGRYQMSSSVGIKCMRLCSFTICIESLCCIYSREAIRFIGSMISKSVFVFHRNSYGLY